ncbi:MAG: hypothetical protein Q9191_001938 [Dirinaria sp. TL-2023a]
MASMDVLTHLVRKQQVQGLSPAPAGVTPPNFVHPVSHGHYLSLASVSCIVIAAIFVFARLWVKLIISHAPGWDDGARIFSSTMACNRRLIHLVKAGIAQGCIYGFATYWAKLTIVLLLLRIFGVDNRFRLAAWILIIFWTLYLIIGQFLLIFHCSPTNKSWDPLLPGHCLNITRLGIASGYVYIIYDFFFILLPVPMVWRLQLATKLKLGVISVFLTGIL